ncbi:anti-sigma factor antagonist [Sphaerisporangium viridialbum]|uniref:STAS domain-containing protein n=1 Tax=Sphaerisporangium viridialbum TaxID=46189 RepID=UPI003C74B971
MQFGADPQQGLTVSRGIRESAVVVQVQGELDYRSAPLLRDELGGIWDIPGISAIILDLSEVTFCDSVGLSELIAVLRRSQNTGHALMISGLQGTLLRVLTITGLHNAFDTYDTAEEALRQASSAVEPPRTVPSILDPPQAAPSGLEPPATSSILEPGAAFEAAPIFEAASEFGTPSGLDAPSALNPPVAMDPVETAPPVMPERPDAAAPGNDVPPGP